MSLMPRARCLHAQSYVEELGRFKAEKSRQLSVVEGHCFYLLDYCNLLATLLANFEKVRACEARARARVRRAPATKIPECADLGLERFESRTSC